MSGLRRLRFSMRRLFFVLMAIPFIPVSLWSGVPVAVSIAPEKTFVQKIAGDLADVTVMVPAGASPATYEPKPSQMKKIARAQLYFAIGVPFEKAWLSRFKAQNRKMKIVDITRGIQKVPMVSHHHHEKGHGSGHESDHGSSEGLDPHVWLAPRMVLVLAENIAEALKERDPKHAAVYQENLERFKKEIDALDKKLKKILEPCRGKAMMVFHPSWGYFARTYGLRQIPIEIEGKEPKPKKLIELIHEAQEQKVTTLFIQPQFSRRAARTLARSIGAKIVVADPLAPDWAQNLTAVAKRICEADR